MERTMENLEEFAHQVFESQPFSRLVGAQLVRSGPGFAELAVKIVDDLKQHHGFVHGGVISYLADNAITFAGGLAFNGDALTAEFKINYLKPATGSELVARATAKSVGRRQAVCIAEVYAIAESEEKLCALAQGTVVSAT
jgi:uncharacterized protein (TIGR00369 family)